MLLQEEVDGLDRLTMVASFRWKRIKCIHVVVSRKDETCAGQSPVKSSYKNRMPTGRIESRREFKLTVMRRFMVLSPTGSPLMEITPESEALRPDKTYTR